MDLRSQFDSIQIIKFDKKKTGIRMRAGELVKLDKSEMISVNNYLVAAIVVDELAVKNLKTSADKIVGIMVNQYADKRGLSPQEIDDDGSATFVDKFEYREGDLTVIFEISISRNPQVKNGRILTVLDGRFVKWD